MKKADKQLATVLFNLTEGKEVHELDKIVDEFIRWLAERQLLHRSRKIVLALDQIWKEKFGASSVTVESAHPLTKKTQQHLVEAVKGADSRRFRERRLELFKKFSLGKLTAIS